MTSIDLSSGVELKPQFVEAGISLELGGGLRRLSEGGDVVKEKRTCVLEAYKSAQPEEALRAIDVAERRGVVADVSRRLEQKYKVEHWEFEMGQLFEANQMKSLDMDLARFKNGVDVICGKNTGYKEMLANEPLALEYLYSQITGRGEELHAVVLERMRSVREGTEVRLNQDTVEIITSLNKIYGSDSVLSTFLSERSGVKDTKFSLFVPITAHEKVTKEKSVRSGTKQALELDDGDFWALLEKIKKRDGLLGMQHGYGADRRVFRQVAGRWLALSQGERFGEEKPRVVGIAMTTKGGESTALVDSGGKVVSGGMDLAAVQEATTLQALGLVGNDVRAETHMRGHSMGGQEMFWLAMYAQRDWNMTFEAFTPVVDNQAAFLSLFGGELRSMGDIPGFINRLSVQGPAMLMQLTGSGKLGEVVGNLIGKVATIEVFGTSLGKLIASYLIDSGEVYSREEIKDIVEIHVENLKDHNYSQGVFRGLKEGAPLTDEMLVAMHQFYGDKFTAIWVAMADRILDPKIMINKLKRTGWASKLKFLAEASHYAFAAKSHVDQLPS